MSEIVTTRHTSVVDRVIGELVRAGNADAHLIVVRSNDGVVTLAGELSGEVARLAARDAAFLAAGVHTVDDQLSTDGVALADPANTEIANRVEHALAGSGIPRALLRAEVRDHGVTLSGRLDWDYERESAVRIVEQLLGVRFVIDRVALVQRPSSDVTMGLIRAELVTNALVDADVIHVSILESEITLTGIVQSDAERREAEHAAWASPHVSSVRNELVVRPL